MKIHFYNHTGQIGGAERVLLTILAGVDRTIIQPVVICPEPGPLRKLIMELGVPVERSAVLNARFTWRPDRALRYLQSFARVILQLRTQIVRFDPDLIHANSVRAGLVATAATIGLRKRIVWHIHDVLPRHPFNLLIRLVALASRRTRIVAVAQAAADRFIGSFRPLKQRVTVIPNGIDVARFHPDLTARRKIRSELKLNEGERVIGMVGRLSPRKGQLELLRVFPELLRKCPNTALVIVGSPAFNREDEYAQLLDQTTKELGISDRVRMLGERDDVAAVLQALDLLVVNSATEACSLVVLEAMACGTPVLATKTGGTAEVIEHEQCGWLVPVRDEKALASAIIKLIGQPDLRARLAENGRQRVASHFTVGRQMSEFQNYYLHGAAKFPVATTEVQPAQAEAKFA
ncbi:MAG TPA: glycosyltransferase family 4 protein [Pyrinomonadaceae bacterium]|jgi:glycosyltransferase involved in cell wall biosynthesis